MTRAFTGGGELGALISGHDWAATPLGSIESWSPALRMMVRFLLANRFPMLLWWGPDYICLYNEAYRPILGAKHPWALGRPVREVWSEVWHQLEPLIDTPFEGGPSTWNDALLFEIRRHGFVEETHFTIAYSPVPDDAAPGGIGGVLATVSEVTEKVVAQRRALALRDLGAKAGDAKTAAEACAVAARTLEPYAKDVPFALFYLLDSAGEALELAGTVGASGAIAPERVELGAPGPWPFAEVLQSGVSQLVSLRDRFSRVPPGPWSDPPDRAVVTTIPSHRRGSAAGVLVAGLSPRLTFDEFYRDYLDLVRAQVANAIGHAEAYEHERRRAESLMALDRAKTVFFANVSHEFRTPLALMLGPLDDLLDADHLSPRARADVELVYRSAIRLQKLVNNLLDFSRIEAGRAEAWFVPTDLAALTGELASTFRSAMERAGLAFTVELAPVPTVHVDRAMWEKIVLNLLSNALKYTPAGQVDLRLERRGARAVLTVRDTGAGIPAAHLPRLFERFHRIPSAQARSVEGSGIGLALVQEMTRLHGGTIEVDSAPERGSTFTVSLPFGTAHLPPDKLGESAEATAAAATRQAYVQEAMGWLAVAPAPPPPGEHLPLVLVADDNADMRDYLRRLLEDRYRVITATDGQTALELARAQTVELVISDVMMPELDGFALLAALRADPRTRAVPIVLLSARAGEEARIEGLQAGADDYLVKPFSARELRARVDAHVQRLRTRRRWQELWQQSPAMVAALRSPAHVFELANPAYANAVGKPAESLVGKPIREALPELEGQGWFELLDHVYAHGQPYVENEVRRMIRGADDAPEERWVNSLNYPTRDRDGNVDGIVIQAVDVTALVQARRQAQAMASALSEHGAWLHDVLDLAPVAIQLLDPKARAVTFSNRIAKELSASAPLVWADLHARLHGGEHLVGVEVTWASDTGPRWMLAYGHLLPAAHGQDATAVLVCQEITAVKRVEEHLRHTQKLEAIAKLAGGVAHEFNNLLTVVVGNAALIMDEDLDPSVRGMAEEIQGAADRAAMLTSYLLAFGRKQILRPALLSLSDLVRRVQPMLRGMLTEAIQLEVNAADDLPKVRADPTHLEHVIMNLVLNARDAMPHGGVLKLTTGAPSHDMVSLVVADTGAGMPDEVKGRVFEPFFTTKPIGQGTGLGLSMCEGIVSQTGGRITLESSAGRGTTVTVLLPVAGEVARPSNPPSRVPKVVTVLLVEDEKPVLRLGASILGRSGFQVLAAATPEEALAMSRRFQGEVHLLVSDVGLPNMSGPELHAVLKQERPGIKVLFMSGMTGHDDEAVLPKPFTPETLRRKVREVLEGA